MDEHDKKILKKHVEIAQERLLKLARWQLEYAQYWIGCALKELDNSINNGYAGCSSTLTRISDFGQNAQSSITDALQGICGNHELASLIRDMFDGEDLVKAAQLLVCLNHANKPDADQPMQGEADTNEPQ